MSPLPIYVNKDWSLFLDRDGVINVRLIDEYVRHPDEFLLTFGTESAVRTFRAIFKYILVFTNQQGVAKGVMTMSDLEAVHAKMNKQLAGQIDRIYACVHHRDEHCSCRKPNTKMLEMAKSEFPDIDFKKSLMVGDSRSDMIFGKRVGCVTVMVCATGQDPAPEADYVVASLSELVDRLVVQ